MDRLVEIETKLAFLEDATQTLNDVVIRQQQQIDQLEAALRLLIDRFRQWQENADASLKPKDEKPPHY